MLASADSVLEVSCVYILGLFCLHTGSLLTLMRGLFCLHTRYLLTRMRGLFCLHPRSLLTLMRGLFCLHPRSLLSAYLPAYVPTVTPGTWSKELARKSQTSWRQSPSPKLRPHVLLGRLQCAGDTGWEERERSSEMRVGRLQLAGDACILLLI